MGIQVDISRYKKKALGALIDKKTHEIDPKEYLAHLKGESDRAAIILIATSIEHWLTLEIEKNMSDINRDERDDLFGFQGPLGSFSSKIRIAQGFGMIDRRLRRSFELVKAMRNAAAHCIEPVSLSDEPFRAAVVLLCAEEERELLNGLSAEQFRVFFELVCYSAWRAIKGADTRTSPELIEVSKTF